MTRSEHAANIHLTAAARRAHVGAHFAKRGPVRRYALTFIARAARTPHTLRAGWCAAGAMASTMNTACQCR